MLSRLRHVIMQVSVCQVHEHPLDPDAVILARIVEFLKTLQVEIAGLWYVVTGLVELGGRRLNKVDLVKERLQSPLGNTANTSAAIECNVHAWHDTPELIYHCNTSVALDLVNRLVSVHHAIHSRWLRVPVVNGAFIPVLLLVTRLALGLLGARRYCCWIKPAIPLLLHVGVGFGTFGSFALSANLL